MERIEKFKVRVKEKLCKYKQIKIQTASAMAVFDKTVPDSKIFLRSFLDTIESHIISMKNFELLYHAVTKEKDQDNDFKIIREVSQSNIYDLFQNYHLCDFRKIRSMTESGIIEIASEDLLNEVEDHGIYNWVYSADLLE